METTPEKSGALLNGQGLVVPFQGLRSHDGTNCAICGSQRLEVLLTLGGKSLRHCLACDVRFVTPQPVENSVEAHFAESPELGSETVQDRFVSNRDNVLERVARSIKKRKRSGKILDVGCAVGYFLAQYFSEPTWEQWGVELSRFAAAKATENGIRTHNGSLRSANYGNAQFDVVTVLDAFYYFPQPQAELNEIRRILKPEGLLVLELPLASSRIWRTTNRLLRGITRTQRSLLESSDHLYYFNSKCILYLLKTSEFRSVEIMPLAANRHKEFSKDFLYRAYSVASNIVWHATLSKWMLGPRFLVTACPGQAEE